MATWWLVWEFPEIFKQQRRLQRTVYLGEIRQQCTSMTIQPFSDQRDHYLDIASPTISAYLVHLSCYTKWPDLLTFGKGNSKLNRRAAQRGKPGRAIGPLLLRAELPRGECRAAALACLGSNRETASDGLAGHQHITY